jgi:NAD(P)-dependent dehydrogenase (short-subunit alcohol dehydrogenase family)
VANHQDPVADATDPAVATRLIDRIAGEVGPPDVLVNTIVHVAARVRRLTRLRPAP